MCTMSHRQKAGSRGRGFSRRAVATVFGAAPSFAQDATSEFVPDPTFHIPAPPADIRRIGLDSTRNMQTVLPARWTPTAGTSSARRRFDGLIEGIELHRINRNGACDDNHFRSFFPKIT
jgi:hypothetical protein